MDAQVISHTGRSMRVTSAYVQDLPAALQLPKHQSFKEMFFLYFYGVG